MQSLFVVIKYNTYVANTRRTRCILNAEYLNVHLHPLQLQSFVCQFIFRYALLEEKYIQGVSLRLKIVGKSHINICPICHRL